MASNKFVKNLDLRENGRSMAPRRIPELTAARILGPVLIASSNQGGCCEQS